MKKKVNYGVRSKRSQTLHIYGNKIKMPKYYVGRYKSLDSYLDKVYELNKNVIDKSEYSLTRAGAKESWKVRVKEFMEDKNKMSVDKAIKNTFKQSEFVTSEERSIKNIERAFVRGGYRKEFKGLVGIDYSDKIDYNKFEYDQDAKAYYYNGTNHGMRWTRKRMAGGEYEEVMEIF